jgi:SNF2 family DNA or RNA helicase
MFKPYEWQQRLWNMGKHHPSLAVLADMGTGKTAGTIGLVRDRYAEYGGIVKTLIISPLVTLFNWKREIHKYSKIPDSRVHVLSGGSARKLKIFQRAIASSENQIIVVNYEAFIAESVRDAIASWAPVIVVMDEGHLLKNHKAKRSKAIEAIAMRARNRYLLTGTLVANSVEDIFMPFKILDGGASFGTNFYAFQRKYMIDENARWSHMHSYFPKWVVNPEKTEEINSLIYAKGIRVMKADCMDLPPLIRETYPVEMGTDQQKAYESMERDYLTYVTDNKGNMTAAVAQTAMTKALRLMQIASGYVTNDNGEEIIFKDVPKLDALEELLSALHVNHKVIVWCSFRPNYKMIEGVLNKLKIKYTRITGDESVEQKEEAQRLFNEEAEYRVVLCNRRAAGIGINLVSSDYAITYSRNYSLTEELQSTDRNYRGGSQIHERITKMDLVSLGTIEEEVAISLGNKKKVSDSIVEFVKSRRQQC